MLCVLFFFSGFPALIYQLTWQRQLFLIFGVNIESVTIVVTAFMLGLGLGSLAGGWLSDRRGISALALARGHRTADRRFRRRVANDLRQGRGMDDRAEPAGDRCHVARSRHRAHAVDGSDPAGVGQSPRAPLRQYRKRGRPALLCQYSWSRRGLPRMRPAAISIPRHERFDLRRRRDQFLGRNRRTRRPLA